MTVVDPIHQSLKPDPARGIRLRTFDVHLDSSGRVLERHVRTEPEAPHRPLEHWHLVRSQWYQIIKNAFASFSDHKTIREKRFGEVEQMESSYLGPKGDVIPYTKVKRDPALMSDDPADWAQAPV
jgi:hypothetical protein